MPSSYQLDSDVIAFLKRIPARTTRSTPAIQNHVGGNAFPSIDTNTFTTILYDTSVDGTVTTFEIFTAEADGSNPSQIVLE